MQLKCILYVPLLLLCTCLSSLFVSERVLTRLDLHATHAHARNCTYKAKL